MFSKAYEIASKFTHPVIVSIRFFDKTVEGGLGSFIILNDEGWIITAAHILAPAFGQQQHAKEITDYNNQVKAIKENDKLKSHLKQRQLKNLKPNNKWITNCSFWWGHDLFKINHFEILRENDLAIGKIENYDKRFLNVYPKLKRPENLKYGTSLCKLGFPFHSVKNDYDEATNSFKLAPGVLPVPRFPIDGIFTREAYAGKSMDGKFDIKFIETSTPGLKGQSGGPTFDVLGNIWAIQSQTINLDLGFAPKIKRDKKEIEENQFINLGLGVHVATLIDFLTDKGVKFELSDE
jgi:hypothetical protein